MKKALKYIIILAVSAVLTLLYGFCVGGEPELWFIGLQIVVAVLIMMYFNKKSQYEPLFSKIIRIVVSTVIVFIFTIGLYTSVSSSSLTLINEYETEVTDIYISGYRSRTEMTVYFTLPNGKEETVCIYADSPLYSDGIPSRGDKIRVGEYKGLFGDIYLEYLGKE